MDGFGRKIVGAIHGHQQLVAKDPKMRQQAVLFKALKDLNKHGIEVARRDRIEQRADLIVTGNLLDARSEEHTSELQSRLHLVCRLLLEKKKIDSQRSNLSDIKEQDRPK